MNRKFVIVVIAIVFGIILYFTIMKLEYENNIEQMSNFFNVTIINVIITAIPNHTYQKSLGYQKI